MLLDNGKQVFVWFGKNASEVEKKLAVKSAQVSQSYDYHMIMMTSLLVIHRCTLSTWKVRKERRRGN